MADCYYAAISVWPLTAKELEEPDDSRECDENGEPTPRGEALSALRQLLQANSGSSSCSVIEQANAETPVLAIEIYDAVNGVEEFRDYGIPAQLRQAELNYSMHDEPKYEFPGEHEDWQVGWSTARTRTGDQAGEVTLTGSAFKHMVEAANGDDDALIKRIVDYFAEPAIEAAPVEVG